MCGKHTTNMCLVMNFGYAGQYVISVRLICTKQPAVMSMASKKFMAVPIIYIRGPSVLFARGRIFRAA